VSAHATGGTEMNGSMARYVYAAWGSVLVAGVVAAVGWIWIANHQGTRGERLPAVLGFYLALLAVSVAGMLAALYGLFGIRSRRSALIIIPGSLLGICGNGFNAFFCLLAYSLEGMNLGG
jgi:hypothetical protein